MTWQANGTDKAPAHAIMGDTLDRAQRIKLTADDVQEIATLMSKFVVYGDRMGEAHMSQIDYTI